jgi:hypothetical protein
MTNANLNRSTSNLNRSSSNLNASYESVEEKEDEELYFTPLHIAFMKNNTQSINLLLKYMAKLEYGSFDVFKDLMPEMINFGAFSEFIEE